MRFTGPCPKLRLLAVSIVLFGGGAFAQQAEDYHEIDPVRAERCATPPIYAGTYHAATGEFTPADQEALPPVTLGVIYNNSCGGGSFISSVSNGTTLIDDGRVPSTTSPAPNTGILNNYQVKQFQIQYCTKDLQGVFNIRVRFWNRDLQTSTGCTPIASLGAANGDYTLTNIPGAATQGTLTCYTLTIDLTGVEFCMQADSDGAFNTDSWQNGFGYGLQMNGQVGTTASGAFFLGGVSTEPALRRATSATGPITRTLAARPEPASTTTSRSIATVRTLRLRTLAASVASAAPLRDTPAST
jgi:hypothetical protein